MSSAGGSTVRLSREFELLATTELDDSELLAAVAERVARVVPCDGCCVSRADPTSLSLTDTWFTGIPATEFVSAFYETESQPQDFARHEELATTRHRAAVLAAMTRGEPRRSPRYRRLLEPMGVEHELRGAAVSGDTPWGFLDLYRRPGRRGFDADELATVRHALPSLAAALRVACARIGTEAERSSPATAPDRAPVTILVDRGLQVVGSAGPADQWLEAMRHPGRSGPSLPIALLSMAFGAMLGRPQTAVPVRAPAGSWWLLSAAALRDPAHADTVAVTAEPAGGTALARVLMRALGLTPAERRVCELVLVGASTNLIADRLQISPYTVQDRLKAVFAKAQVGSRGELVARLLTV